MDLLGGYGSSSDEEDQPGTTTNTAVGKAKATVSKRVKKDVWSKNFQKIKEFYDEKKHLTLPGTDPNSARLSQWLTQQRYRPTSLRKDQLERLESINYKTAKFHRDGDDEKWNVKYNL
jgi:hypothetical protein